MSIMSYNGAAVIGARATTRATTRRARFGDSVFFFDFVIVVDDVRGGRDGDDARRDARGV